MPASASRLGEPAQSLYLAHMGKLDPIVSEFKTDEDAAAYDAWFRAQVETALASKAPRVPHEQVVSRVREILQKYRDAAADLGT